MALIFGLAACGQAPPPAVERSSTPATAVPAPAAEIRIVVLGNSLAAGLGLAERDAFPAVLESLLRGDGLDVEIVNAGVSGDTSAGGLSRLDWALQRPADILIVELGGNDALRGQPLENTAANLRQIVRRGRDSGADVILLGMDVPINYGPTYATAFSELYPRIAEEEGVTLVPGFVRVLGENPELLQPDGLHPTAEGQRRLAETLFPIVADTLDPE